MADTEGRCVLFAGQSVQTTGMGLELWKLKPAREILERLKPSLGEDLEAVTTVMPEAELALTFNAQRAIHACHLGHWFAYKALKPSADPSGAIGHSMGVVAALVAAGALTVEESGAFMRARAQAFSDVCKTFPEPMGLAAVATDDLQDVLDELPHFPGVSLALRNTVGRGTLGGTAAALEAFARRAQDEDWPVKVTVLKVEGPYHTSAFEPCLPALEKAAAGLDLKAPRVPVYMGTSGKREDDPARIRQLLARQAASPELHLEAVRAAHADGRRSFVEVSHKPQPVTWLRDQLPEGAYDAKAVTTAELAA